MKKREQIENIFDTRFISILRNDRKHGRIVKSNSEADTHLMRLRRSIDHDLDLLVICFEQEILNEET